MAWRSFFAKFQFSGFSLILLGDVQHFVEKICDGLLLEEVLAVFVKTYGAYNIVHCQLK